MVGVTKKVNFLFYIRFIYLFILGTGSHVARVHVAKDDTELLILLPPCRVLGLQVCAAAPGFLPPI